jgi:signal transduction histidine kinase
MNRALKFRRGLGEAGAIVIVILCLAFYFAFRSAGQAEGMNRWVARTEDILGIIARARLERTRLQNQVWAYRATHNPELPGRFLSDLRDLREDMDRLQVLTRDNPGEQRLLAELTPIVTAQASSLERAMQQAVSASTTEPSGFFDWSLPLPSQPSDRQRRLFNSLDSNERALLAARSAAVEANARKTRGGLLMAGVLTFVILLAAGHLIQQEILMRAKVAAGMRVAQEMLGMKYEEQGAELDHAMGDLHAQIRARQQSEDVIRELNRDLEKRVRQRTIELEEMNREFETFSYSVSHDLRAPLRHLEGFSRILQQEYGPKLPDEAQHYLGRIRGAATHMSELVEDLLQLSRIGRQPARREVHSLRALVDEARAEVLQESDGRKIVWQIYSLPDVEADPVLLRQVFTNLFSNAVKFTRQQRNTVIEVGSLEENGMNVIFVRDNGAGFDSRYADKLFGVFQRLHRQDEFEGTGIGLATVQRIIHKHGGRVWAESQPSEGATFYFSLPVSPHTTRELQEIIGALG